jgi:tetratricopeptide (TPR) repeat protein
MHFFASQRMNGAATASAESVIRGVLLSGCILLMLAGCALQTAPDANGPSAEEIARKDRNNRALTYLGEGQKRYDAGAYDEAMKNFLLAVDSGVLTIAQQITARKQMAFIHCVMGRESACKDEFQKILALDAKFDLPPAEAGHPSWGPVFRTLKSEGEIRKSRFPSLPSLIPSVPTPTVAERRAAEGKEAYEAADYNKAIKSYLEALKEPLVDSEQIRIRKFLAFSYCLTNKSALCRAEFEKILQLRPEFDLEAAESGHPSWGPSFRLVKSRQKPAPAKK